MKRCIIISMFLTSTMMLNAQNVGIGTTTPLSKLSVGPSSQFQVDLAGDIKMLNAVPYSFPTQQGSAGQVLLNDGNGNLTWSTVNGIYMLNQSNYTTTTVPADNYVFIKGTINLVANYTGLASSKLNLNGGTISGNGSTVLSLGNYSVCNGTSFNNVDIDGQILTFVNCTFSGNCPRIAGNSRFINCQFSSVTTSFFSNLGVVEHSTLSNCTIPRATEFINCALVNCTIGNGIVNQTALSKIIGCTVNSSTIYALQSDFVFTNNICYTMKIVLGNASQTSSVATISNNQFNSVLLGATEVIEINPASLYYKIFTIQNNSFLMQSGDPRIISIAPNDGGINTLINVQGNTFWRSAATLVYSSTIKVNYSQNVAYNTSHPSTSGNLFVNNNYNY